MSRKSFSFRLSSSPLRALFVMVALLGTFALLRGPVAAAPAPDQTPVGLPLSVDAGEPPQLFQANLSGAKEVPPVMSWATGRAVLALSDDMTTLYWRILVDDITNITASHIHEGAPGENGPVIFPLFDGTGDFGPNDPVSGSITLDASQLETLLAGNYYVNVHTTDHPAGEIRGQIEGFTPQASFNALLEGNNEVPPVTTDALGVARFTLANNDTLEFEVEVTEIQDITASHIHKGRPGENGPVILTLFDGTDTFDPDHPIDGTLTLDAENLVDLLTGFYYVNVHTTAHPGGEIRGQIGGARLFDAALSGSEEVPPVTTNASGRAVLSLTADTSTLFWRVLVDDITNITASHIHEGAPGENGPVIFPLFDGTGPFGPDDPISGSFTLTADQLFTLMAGNYYVNVHTTQNPGGEIRGQIGDLEPPTHFVANLSGDNEVPPVETDASGTAHLTLNPLLDILHYHVMVSDIMNITASHIHKGPSGENGPVIFPLYDGTGIFNPDHPVGGALLLNAENLVDLLTNFYYVNVHTTAHPGGEIRGQIVEEAEPTALTLGTFRTATSRANLPWALATASLLALAGASLAWRRQR